jgi:hypothetical protein
VKLTVNGTPQPNVAFGSPGAWGDWHQIYTPVTLAAGKRNVIRIESTDQESANIDELRVFAGYRVCVGARPAELHCAQGDAPD